ncbi:cysteine hydrolase family protein [Lysobacter sp. cf310]|uniref:cysteine hydrolase family protein n=1 Tax=Lysobacter sp. cf310 TaxID=1761790 RepID=UPI0008E67145|nr:cysteine hydrolase family protein [Lysobacter sp. cf310]SFL10815.1 Nicotinamidase-related amidase [Lysobacter sp. cf310]
MTCALLVIDVQSGLFDGEPRPDDADAVIARLNALIARARDAGAPVIFVRHERIGTLLEPGTPGWAFQAQLDVHDDDLIVGKTSPDAFLRTSLEDLLQSLDVDRLVIGGYASDFCVDTTTRRAAALGYPVTLAADAHTTHDKPHLTAARIREHHNVTLSDIVSFGVEIRAVDSAQIQFERRHPGDRNAALR